MLPGSGVVPLAATADKSDRGILGPNGGNIAKGSDVIWCGSPVIEVYGKLLCSYPYRFGRVIVQHASSPHRLPRVYSIGRYARESLGPSPIVT